MKPGWKARRLGDLCRIELGRTPARANKAFWDGKRETGNVWLSIADLLNAENDIVTDSKEYISDQGALISRAVPEGTLLVSFKLTLGRVAFAGRDLYTNEAIAALTIFDERELSKEFLFWFLRFFDWRKAAESDAKLKGMTLNKAKLAEIIVYYPSVPEQQQIVAALGAAFEAVAQARAITERKVRALDDLRESLLRRAFVDEP